jgi:hypothetical protein
MDILHTSRHLGHGVYSLFLAPPFPTMARGSQPHSTPIAPSFGYTYGPPATPPAHTPTLLLSAPCRAAARLHGLDRDHPMAI